ncbi:helix-turn-helix domain-containing protein [Paracidovorax anthurii]|uniref:Putative transcriptional regulator n=1 Tax=Paracidovorax anthurii TaxID=78229 RepID=A0A328YHE8_9BURK|nr:helix-turn-helix transcriptional regulator [Paracidovorax anthurii]RAR71412.1 putative transcriptional regulator [Paracidovorax anthurii]
MPIRVTLGVILAQRNVRSKDLAAFVGITEANLSLLRRGHVKGIRFDTLERICAYLQCQPGDLLAYTEDAPPPPDGGDGPQAPDPAP